MLGLSFLGKLFGSDKAIEKGIDTVSNGLDKLIYTKEEKAEDAMKERAAARGMLIEWMTSTQGQNLARRLLALVITAVWLGMYLLSAVLDVSIIWADPRIGDSISLSAKVIGERATEMNGAMMLILGFYFAAPHMGNIITTAMTKFGGKNASAQKEA